MKRLWDYPVHHLGPLHNFLIGPWEEKSTLPFVPCEETDGKDFGDERKIQTHTQPSTPPESSGK